MKRKVYTTVHIPKVMADGIDEVMTAEVGAYSSRSEFVKDAVRRRLEDYGVFPKKIQRPKEQK
jgi:Arc/MetJ-type ribon-helix-helix transcriptional regulator